MTVQRGRARSKTPASQGPRIYTRTGDRGQTGLIGGQRVPKDHLRVETYGAVDELNAQLGVVRAQTDDPPLATLLDEVQHRLFDVGAALATPARGGAPVPAVGAADIGRLEEAIDQLQAPLPLLREFILPGGTPLAAALHVARTVCRRAERRVVTLAREDPVHPDLLRYLNRLSDLLFVMARAANHRAGRPDVIWQKHQ